MKLHLILHAVLFFLHLASSTFFKKKRPVLHEIASRQCTTTTESGPKDSLGLTALAVSGTSCVERLEGG